MVEVRKSSVKQFMTSVKISITLLRLEEVFFLISEPEFSIISALNLLLTLVIGNSKAQVKLSTVRFPTSFMALSPLSCSGQQLSAARRQQTD